MLAYHIDLKRAMWNMEYLLRYGRKLRKLGCTHVLLEVEDKFRFRRHPDIVHPDAFSHGQYRELIAAYVELGLNVIPLWQTLGHAESVVGRFAYTHLREQEAVDDQYDPGSREVYALLFELIDELIDVMAPAEFFHLGGDETRRLGASERLQPLVEEIGTGGVYVRHMLPLFEHVYEHGLRPVVWADMALTHPDILARIPKWVVMMDWDYTRGRRRAQQIRVWGEGLRDVDGIESLPYGRSRDLVEQYAIDDRTEQDGKLQSYYTVDALTGMGLDVVVASASRSWGDSAGIPDNRTHLPNAFFSARRARRVLGTIVTSWAVRHNHPETHWPANRIAARALVSRGSYDEPALVEDFTRRHYGVGLPAFHEAMLSAGRTWNAAQASNMSARMAALEEGRDPFEPDIHELSDGTADPGTARERLQSIRDDHAAALEAFERMAGEAQRNVREFDYWLEGIRYNLLFDDCLLAALNADHGAVGALQERWAALRDRSRQLMEATYTPRSVEQELDVRYGFLQAWLSGF